MESPGARSMALLAVRCIRRQVNPVLNSGMRLDQSLVLGGAGLMDSILPRGSWERSGLGKDESFPSDCAISHLEALIAPIRDGELGHTSGRWNRAHVMNSLVRGETRLGFAKGGYDFMMNSAQRELEEQLALVRMSGRDLSRFSTDLAESSREGSSFVTVVADSSVEACYDSCTDQEWRPKKEVSRIASLLGHGEVGLGLLSVLEQDHIPFECSSVKRKRKKKMNKHKQRKLRRRDRHRNT